MNPDTDTNVDYNKPAVQRVAAKKYRPSLTAKQVEHILFLAKTELPHLSKASMSLISTLAPFQAKIENEGIAAAYTVSNKPKANSLEALGAGNPVDSMSKEDHWEYCYDLWLANPATCSIEAIKGAAEHRYLNDLMTPEEETAHESK